MRAASLLLLLVVLNSLAALANHPSEGALTLESLIAEASVGNREVRESEKFHEATSFAARARLGAFLPTLSLEGGPLRTKLEEERNSGTGLYGLAEWNLYRGGSDQALAQKAELERAFSERQLALVKARVAREVSRAYFEMLFLLESMTLKEKALEMNKEQMKLARAKRGSGFTSEADVIEFELREATLSSDLQELARARDEEGRRLSVLLGRTEPSILLVKGHLPREPLQLDKAKVMSRLSELNPEILEAKLARDLSEADKRLSRSGFLPVLNLQAEYGRLMNDEKVFRGGNNFRAMLKFSVPIFSGFSTKNEVKATSATFERREIEVTRKEFEVRTAVESNFSRLEALTRRMDLEERTLARSEEYYKLTLGEYRRGVKNSPDMVGAAERLLEARLRNLEFRKNFQLSKLDILSLTGTSMSDLN